MTPPQAALPGELREDENFTTALYRAAIGPVSTSYYLALFTAWESAGRWRPHWNTAAGLWTLGWLGFRRMGGIALAYVGALVATLLLIFGVGGLIFSFSTTQQMLAFALWLAVAVLVPGLCGNRWFHQQCRQRMDLALAAHSDVAEACAALALQSSPRKRALVIGGVQAALLLALGFSALQFSSLMQHTGFPLVGAAPAPSPQTATGKVKDLALPLVAANAAPASAPASAPLAGATATPAVAASAAVSSPLPVPASVPATAPTSVPVKAPVSAPAPAPAKAAAVSAPAPAKPPAPVTGPVTVTVTAKASPSGPTVQVTATGRYGVNVGLFAKAENAQNARVKLELASLPVLSDTLNMPHGPRIRVRVGPFSTQAQADAAVLKIRALGLDAVAYRD
jgi:cell division protein FtsN